jgi:hypothetical protein
MKGCPSQITPPGFQPSPKVILAPKVDLAPPAATMSMPIPARGSLSADFKLEDSITEQTVITAPAAVVPGLDGKHHVHLHVTRDDGMYENGHVIPTEEELAILPKVAGKMPWTAYMLCGVEFAERASYYGCNQVFKNFIRAPLPVGGNGAGAPARGTQQTAGALGKGTVIASAMADAFKFLAYALYVHKDS